MHESSKTALVVVDMQNAFCDKRGSYALRGNKILNLSAVIRNIKGLIAYARKMEWPIIFTRLAFNSSYTDAGLLIDKNPQIRELHAYEEGTWDSEIIPELSIQEDDIILTKKHYDAFLGTDLEETLTEMEIRCLVVGGVLTNVCVESLVRSAFDRGFETIVIEDMVSSYSLNAHQSALRTMKRHFARITSTRNILQSGKS